MPASCAHAASPYTGGACRKPAVFTAGPAAPVRGLHGGRLSRKVNLLVRQLGPVSAVGNVRAVHGGFPRWFRGGLWWADIPDGVLHRFHPASGETRSWRFGEPIGAIVPTLDHRLMVATRRAVWRFDPRSGQKQFLVDAPYDQERFQFNEGGVDPRHGHLWIGTYSKENVGVVYRLVGRTFQPVLDAGGACNGLGWDVAGDVMYFADTRKRIIYAHDFTEGMPLRQRVFFDGFKPPERPDCGDVDAQGNYWNAVFEGGRVICISPEGQLLLSIDLRELGVLYPTAVRFGGWHHRRWLFITTSRLHLSTEEQARQPLAGRLLGVPVDVAGPPMRGVRLVGR